MALALNLRLRHKYQRVTIESGNHNVPTLTRRHPRIWGVGSLLDTHRKVGTGVGDLLLMKRRRRGSDRGAVTRRAYSDYVAVERFGDRCSKRCGRAQYVHARAHV